jgi:hypothetical protein
MNAWINEYVAHEQIDDWQRFAAQDRLVPRLAPRRRPRRLGHWVSLSLNGALHRSSNAVGCNA